MDIFRYTDAETGEVLVTFDMKSPKIGMKSRRFLRAGLRKLLVRVCESERVDIVWGARILKCEQASDASVVSIHFENGDVQQFDLLIGGASDPMLHRQRT